MLKKQVAGIQEQTTGYFEFITCPSIILEKYRCSNIKFMYY